VSAATGWELATKVRLGQLSGAEQLHHGVHAGAYRQAHRDPFDRLLAGVQATVARLSREPAGTGQNR